MAKWRICVDAVLRLHKAEDGGNREPISLSSSRPSSRPSPRPDEFFSQAVIDSVSDDDILPFMQEQ